MELRIAKQVNCAGLAAGELGDLEGPPWQDSGFTISISIGKPRLLFTIYLVAPLNLTNIFSTPKQQSTWTRPLHIPTFFSPPEPPQHTDIMTDFVSKLFGTGQQKTTDPNDPSTQSHTTQSGGPASKTAGPHSSNIANKADPRVDSDADASRNAGLRDPARSYGAADTATGTTGTHGGTTGTHSGTTGTHSGTTGTYTGGTTGKFQEQPMRDSDLDHHHHTAGSSGIPGSKQQQHTHSMLDPDHTGTHGPKHVVGTGLQGISSGGAFGSNTTTSSTGPTGPTGPIGGLGTHDNKSGAFGSKHTAGSTGLGTQSSHHSGQDTTGLRSGAQYGSGTTGRTGQDTTGRAGEITTGRTAPDTTGRTAPDTTGRIGQDTGRIGQDTGLHSSAERNIGSTGVGAENISGLHSTKQTGGSTGLGTTHGSGTHSTTKHTGPSTGLGSIGTHDSGIHSSPTSGQQPSGAYGSKHTGWSSGPEPSSTTKPAEHTAVRDSAKSASGMGGTGMGMGMGMDTGTGTGMGTGTHSHQTGTASHPTAITHGGKHTGDASRELDSRLSSSDQGQTGHTTVTRELHDHHPSSTTAGHKTGDHTHKTGDHTHKTGDHISHKTGKTGDHSGTHATGAYGTGHSAGSSGRVGNVGASTAAGAVGGAGLGDHRTAGPGAGASSGVKKGVAGQPVAGTKQGQGVAGGKKQSGAASGAVDSRASGPAPNTAGPHHSDLLNKLDPRVDSDLDGSRTLGSDKTLSAGDPTQGNTGKRL